MWKISAIIQNSTQKAVKVSSCRHLFRAYHVFPVRFRANLGQSLRSGEEERFAAPTRSRFVIHEKQHRIAFFSHLWHRDNNKKSAKGNDEVWDTDTQFYSGDSESWTIWRKINSHPHQTKSDCSCLLFHLAFIFQSSGKTKDYLLLSQEGNGTRQLLRFLWTRHKETKINDSR